MQVLAGDIGGTHSRLLLAEVDGPSVKTIHEEHYASQAFASLEEVLQLFLATIDRPPLTACFAVAGPVQGQQAQITNLPWRVETTALQHHFAFTRVELLNDFAAIGYSLPVLTPHDYLILQEGNAQPAATRLVLGAGTGLGVALVTECNGASQVLPSEAGHMDFAPRSKAECELANYLLQFYPRLSYEHLLSGQGLINLYRYQLHRSGQAAASDSLLQQTDPAAAISQAASAGTNPSALEALAKFLELYGACAGNLALLGLALGGVYVAGGIAAKLAALFADSEFLTAFHAKSPMTDLMQEFPVKILVNERVGLLGAACYAGRLQSG